MIKPDLDTIDYITNMNTNNQQPDQEIIDKYPCSENYIKNIDKLDAYYKFYYLNEEDD